MANPVTDTVEESAEVKVDPLHEIRENYRLAEEYWGDEREAALDDIKFRAGDQWPADIVALRGKRPCLVVDKVSQYIRQIVNDGRMNRPAIKVAPVDSKADVATAEVLAGIVKHIESESGADAAYDTALDHAATCGFGFFRVVTEYVGDETFDQKICIKRVRNPLSIIIDPSTTEADASDIKFAFEVELIPKAQFEEMYPGKRPADFETNDTYADWFGEYVRVARYWKVVEEDRTLYQMVDGSVISKAHFDELKEGGALELDSLVKAKRNIPVRKVTHALVYGAGYLEEPQEWPGKWIPLAVVYGNEIDVEGKVTHSGIIRPAKDAQRIYNFSRSAFAERVALTPKAPWVAADGQIEDYETEWQASNTSNVAVLRYKPVSIGGTAVPPPQRVNPSDVPAGFQADMQISEHDIQGAIGMYASNLGAPSNERSGKAIMARQREGDTGTFHYHDNLNRAIRHAGRIVVDLIPKIYDSNRVVRIMGYDGKVGEATIDPNLPNASKQVGVKTIYNLGVGTYDVTINAGPSYNTLRQEAAASMEEIISRSPDLMGVIGDLVVKYQDWPGAQEISERLKLVLPPQIQQAEMERAESQLPPEMQQLVQQMNQMLAQKDEAINAAADEIERLREENKDLQIGHDLKAADLRIKAKAEDTRRMEVITAARNDDRLEWARLEHEDKWKELEAHVRVLVAEIAAEKAERSDSDENESSATLRPTADTQE